MGKGPKRNLERRTSVLQSGGKGRMISHGKGTEEITKALNEGTKDRSLEVPVGN